MESGKALGKRGLGNGAGVASRSSQVEGNMSVVCDMWYSTFFSGTTIMRTVVYSTISCRSYQGPERIGTTLTIMILFVRIITFSLS